MVEGKRRVNSTHRRVELTAGILAAVPGLAITFVSNHSLSVGLLVFGLWALVTGITVSQLLRRAGERNFRPSWQLTEAVGLVALVLWGFGQYWSYQWVVGAWAIAFAIITLVRTRRANLFVAALTGALGLAQLVMPVNPIVNVGLLGAYFVVVGVWLIIGALSPKSASNVNQKVETE